MAFENVELAEQQHNDFAERFVFWTGSADRTVSSINYYTVKHCRGDVGPSYCGLILYKRSMGGISCKKQPSFTQVKFLFFFFFFTEHILNKTTLSLCIKMSNV